ncbi:MAG: hypothetical protein ACK51V_00405, partial [bacterium]
NQRTTMKKAATPPGAAKGKKAQSPKPRKTSKAKTVKPVVVKPTGNPVAESKNAKVQKVAKADTKTAKVSNLPSPDQPEQKTVSKPDTDKRGRGRPTDYKPEYCELATKFCLLGADDEDLARMFDVDVRTIYLWKDAHPDFIQAITEGKDIADAEISAKLFHRAKGYSHKAVKIVADAKTGMEHIVPYTEHYPPDTAACIFWLKNRQRAKWRDKVEQEVTGPDGGPQEIINHVVKTDYDKLRAKLNQHKQVRA